MNTSTIRTRWAAVGAAVAITLGAGGIGLVSATSPSGATAYVPIEPCRAADTRPGSDNVGPRATPIAAADTHVINSNDGQCSGDVPGTATGLQLNVTAVGATAGSFITIWASGTRPLASSLNPTPGEPPVPNAVTTGITGAGTFNVYNNAGSVHVIVDIVGYYTDHNHDDRYYTETEVDAVIAATKFINLPAIFDVEGKTSDSPFGSRFLDATVLLPPDYTPGAPMTLRVNLIANDDPCAVALRGNYAYIFRDGLGNVDDNGGSVSGAISDPPLVNFASTSGRASRTIDIAIGAPGTIPLRPNDGISLGLYFYGPGTTCADAHVHAAMLLYS